MRGLTAVLVGCAVCVAVAQADVYKYVDAEGKVYFSDAPLKGPGLQLEWTRESKRLVRESETRTASLEKGGATATRQRARPVSGSLEQRRAGYETLIEANARRYGVPVWLIHAVIRAESAYQPSAVSPAGAQGLMQLMPGTAARYGVSDSFDPVENIRGGTAYLRDLLDLFDWDLKLALAGYNAGEGAVIKHGRTIPPYAETQGYVRKVFEYGRAELANTPSVVLSVR
ncbi:MAG: DUF4124 domain-containing protein [Sphingobacteriia bacterium]|nr:DUF4124 domain-containing protein [Sphingobacteriia bacterium]NCC40332.1 DUF4124 domain-containing protein [Gammaproteobacteria bacterium]